MSTNFYFTPATGHALAQYGKFHIGKRSAGYEFLFRAYTVQGGTRPLEIAPGLYITVEVPALVIESHLDWLKLLRETPGEIRDEYSALISLAEFEAEIESLSPGKEWRPGQLLRNQHDELVSNEDRYGKVDPKQNWKDERGFSFSNYLFS